MNSIINSLKSLAQRADHPAGLTITRRGCPPGDLLPFPSFFVIVNTAEKRFLQIVDPQSATNLNS